MDFILKWLPAIMFMANLLVIWMAWSMKQVAVAAGETLREKIADQELRIIHLEAAVKSLPTSRDVSHLREDIAKLSQEVKGASEMSRTLQRGVDFLTQFMVEHGPK